MKQLKITCKCESLPVVLCNKALVYVSNKPLHELESL